MIITDDITENEIKNAQLRQLQKMALVGTLAGGLAHDFNNILCGIIATVYNMKLELSEDPVPDREIFRNHLNLIDKAGEE